ncbi:MAG: class I adenylate-forming enzyme family protein [Lautropia sp.]
MDLPRAHTCPDLMDEMAARFGGRDFVVDHRRRLDYAAFRAEVRALAKGLYALGVRRGDKVALLMGNQAEWLVVDFAVMLLGGVLVALNTWWRREELHHALAGTDTSVLVMVDRYLGNDYVAMLGELQPQTTLPQLRTIIGSGESRTPGAIAYEDVIRRGGEVADATLDAMQHAIAPDDTAMLLFTSGSTARSKAVRLTHRDSIVNMHAIGERMHLTEHDRMLVPTSLFWSLSCLNALFAVMTHGGTLVLLYRYEAGEMLRLIEAEGCTGAYTLPQIVLQLHAHPDRRQRDLSRWRTGICRSNMIERMAEIGATEMITGYGLTECYGQSVQTDGHDPIATRARNVGRPLPGVELAIVDPETRERLPDGAVGEIRLRGRVTPGYYRDPERTRACIDDAGWFYTGDIGVIEADGSLTFKGRFKDVIKTGGINVTPADVEDVLLAHPAVEQAVVVGVPDHEREEIVSAMVVPRTDRSVAVDELLEHCRQAAAAYKVPRFLQIVTADEIPLTDTGKVHKANARALMTERYRMRHG